jgi:tRNA pseudouridine13 synthase
MVSVPFSALDRLGNLVLDKAKILKIDRHSNKLRLGHLTGNRFTIAVHDTITPPLPRAETILGELQKRGVPNLFGEQRYGVLGNSARLGHLLLQKDFTAFVRELIGDPALIRDSAWQQAATLYRDGNIKEALAIIPRHMRDERQLLQALTSGKSHRAAVSTLSHSLLRLFLAAAQSQLFDQLLLQRLPHLDHLWDGDIAVKHINGACFRVEQAITEQSRIETFEISPTAPLFGHKVLLASGKQGEKELEILRNNGLKQGSWKLEQGLTMSGERLPLRVAPTEIDIIDQTKNSLTLRFALPKGSYATSLLREIIKHS